MCTVDLILGTGPAPATLGVKVHLLWRNKLDDPFTEDICFRGEEAISGKCIAERVEGGWRCVDRGRAEDDKGADDWLCMDDNVGECLKNTFGMWYKPGAEAPTSPHIAAAARPKKKRCTGADSLKGVYRCVPRAAAPWFCTALTLVRLDPPQVQCFGGSDGGGGALAQNRGQS